MFSAGCKECRRSRILREADVLKCYCSAQFQQDLASGLEIVVRLDSSPCRPIPPPLRSGSLGSPPTSSPPFHCSVSSPAQVRSMIIFYYRSSSLAVSPKGILMAESSSSPSGIWKSLYCLSNLFLDIVLQESHHHSPISSPTHLYKLVISPPLSRTVAESSFVSNSSVSRSSPMTSLPLLPSSSST